MSRIQSPALAEGAESRPASRPVFGGTYFHDMSSPRQVWEAVGGALVTGALVGLFLDLSVWLYIAGIAVSFIGGSPAATQHRTLRGALARAGLGGLVWGCAVLLFSSLVSRDETVALPEPRVGYLVFAIVPPLLLALVVWWVTGLRAQAAARRGTRSR